MKTVVIFRKFKRDREVIALFPLIPESSPGTCLSYMHVGQHSAASLGLVHETKQARLREPEVQALKKELESIGYVLDVRVRMPSRDLIHAARIKYFRIVEAQ